MTHNPPMRIPISSSDKAWARLSGGNIAPTNTTSAELPRRPSIHTNSAVLTERYRDALLWIVLTHILVCYSLKKPCVAHPVKAKIASDPVRLDGPKEHFGLQGNGPSPEFCCERPDAGVRIHECSILGAYIPSCYEKKHGSLTGFRDKNKQDPVVGFAGVKAADRGVTYPRPAARLGIPFDSKRT